MLWMVARVCCFTVAKVFDKMVLLYVVFCDTRNQIVIKLASVHQNGYKLNKTLQVS